MKTKSKQRRKASKDNASKGFGADYKQLNPIKMDPLSVSLPDKVEAKVQLGASGITTDPTGTPTVSLQKVLKDDDTGETENDGDPVTPTLTPDEIAAYQAAVSPWLTSLATRVFAKPAGS